MPVAQVLLKVSPVNDIAQAVSVDVTSDILSAGKTVYTLGIAGTTRWYFAVLTDADGNTSTHPLGSYTTASTIEASRLLDSTYPLSMSGSVGTVLGTDVAVASPNSFFARLSSSQTFTVGVRLKFNNLATYSDSNSSLAHYFQFRLYGSVNGANNVFFNLYNYTATTGSYTPAVKWTNRTTGTLISGNVGTIMKTDYFWVFYTGTGSSITFRSFDTDGTTLTASSTVSMVALSGELRLQLFNSFKVSTLPNPVTFDKVWYKAAYDAAVTPASTV